MYWLGSISGASGAYYNNRTGVSGIGAFSIPTGLKGAFYLEPSASGCRFLLSAATGVTNFVQADGLNTAQLQGPGILNGPFRFAGQPVIGVFNGGATQYSVRVFGAPSS